MTVVDRLPPSSRPRGPALARVAATAGIVAAVVVVGLLLFARGGGYTVTATFDNAGQLVKGNRVEVGGVPVGSVEHIGLDPDGRAVVKMSVNGPLSPLHEGTTALIRANSLSGIANRYISLDPGPSSAPKIPDGGAIHGDRTQAPVDLDQLFDTLDPKTRRGLQLLVQGSAAGIQGKSRQAARSIRYLSPALSTTARLTSELVRDREVFRRFVIDTSSVVTALAERRNDLAGLVQNTATTARAIGDENVALDRALALLPATLRRANTTFANLRSTLDDLDTLVNASKPATRRLAPFLHQLRGLVTAGRPTIRDLRFLIRRAGPSNDLIDLTAKMPRLDSIARRTFPHDIAALRQSLPVIEYARPYAPELTGWFTKFGQGAATYDANGHYARIQPIFDAFQLTSTPTGDVLTPVPPGSRLSALQTRRENRCPGGSVQPPPDGSAPWRDTGGQLDCDPTTVPPGP